MVHLQHPAHGMALPLRKSILAPQAGVDCRIRDRGPVSMYEDARRRRDDRIVNFVVV